MGHNPHPGKLQMGGFPLIYTFFLSKPTLYFSIYILDLDLYLIIGIRLAISLSMFVFNLENSVDFVARFA